MVKLIIGSILLVCMAFQVSPPQWAGKYSYEIPGSIATEYTLNIKKDSTCIYEGSGERTYFKVKCQCKLKGERLEIYWQETASGAYYPDKWIDKTKPIMALFYQNGILYTDECQIDKSDTSPKLLFKKNK